MFYLILRVLFEKHSEGNLSFREYREAVVKLAELHGVQAHGIG